MTNRLFQGVLHQMKDSIDRTVGVADGNGEIVACSDLSRIGNVFDIDPAELQIGTAVLDSFTFKRIAAYTGDPIFVFVEGDDSISSSLSSALAITLGEIKTNYDNSHDKSSFIRSVILDNILPSDINIKARELGVECEQDRVVYLVRFKDRISEPLPIDILSNMFPDKVNETVAAVGENEVALIKDLSAGYTSGDIELTAKQIVDTITTDYYVNAEIGIGSVISNLRDLARSYKEAQFSLDVGKVFGVKQSIASYEKLGIGRLIYQLPTTLCEMYLQEVFHRGKFETLDNEALTTINCFFENNLNVSETARKLFIHRNTLVYRLEKIKKLTGLDLREFDSAVTFKVAIMVKQYLDAQKEEK